MPSKAAKERLLGDVSLWQADGLLSEETADLLRERWSAPGIGVGTVAKSVGIAGAVLAGFGILGAGAALTGSALVGAFVALSVAAGLLLVGLRMARDPLGAYVHSSRIIVLLGVLALNGGFGLLLTGLEIPDPEVMIGFVSLPVVFSLAYLHRNIFLVILGLLQFFIWVGSAAAMLGRSTYGLSVQDPRVMAVVALLVLGVGVYHERDALRAKVGRFYQAYQAVSLVYLNLSLLILSIDPNAGAGSGPRSDLEGEPLVYILLWALAGVAQLLLGARLDNPLMVGFGVTALAVNLYTRFFERFWDSLDAGLFFLLGGGILFAVAAGLETLLRRGRAAEQEVGS